jgi:hypothetical protein
MKGKIVALMAGEWNKCCKTGNFDAKCVYPGEIRRMALILLGVCGSFRERSLVIGSEEE